MRRVSICGTQMEKNILIFLDYLGVEIKDFSEKTISFKKAREYARSLKFRKTKEWVRGSFDEIF